MGREKLSEFEKGQILAFDTSGKCPKEIAKHLGRDKSTVTRFLRRYRTTGKIERRPGSGRPRITTPQDDRHIKLLVTRDRRTPAKAIKQDLALEHISDDTIRRRLHEFGFLSRWAVKKPFISETNRKKRVEWAKEHLSWTKEQWGRVLFSDESPYTIRGSSRFRVWRGVNERYLPSATVATVKHSKKINVWGCFAAGGVGHLHRISGIMDQQVYRQILIHHMVPSAKGLFPKGDWVFQHDNDPKHTARSVKTYLANRRTKVLPWPAQSPDLNPIENIWSWLEWKLQRRTCKNEEELFELLQEQWQSISSELLRSLIDSMPARCQAVIDAKGYAIKY